MDITELALNSYVAHVVSEVSDEERCPHIDAIHVGSLMVISHPVEAHSSYSISLTHTLFG